MELKKYRLGEIVDFNKETISRQDKNSVFTTDYYSIFYR